MIGRRLESGRRSESYIYIVHDLECRRDISVHWCFDCDKSLKL